LNAKKKQSKPWLWGLLLVLVVVPLAVLLVTRLEGQLPTMELKMDGAALGAEQTLTLAVADDQSGLRQVWVAILKEGKETVLADKQYPSTGIFGGGMVHTETLQLPFEPKALGLTDGKAVLRLVTRDYSWRHWGAGNQQYQEQEVVIDTQSPTISIISQQLNLNQGGSGVVMYRLSEACPTSGIQVGDDFYPGATGAFSDAKIYMTLIALNHRQGVATQLYATATDYAGNQGRTGLARHINARQFKKDTIAISDSFLSWKMPELKDQVEVSPGASLLEIFLKVNRDLRKANYEVFKKITAHSDATVYWKGDFLRLPSSANRAGYADFRTYIYKGKAVDKQTHLGIDLASMSQSSVPAANAGKVAFADNLGIYGLAVVIDHGFGLFSVYGHLSEIGVSVGQMVARGDEIGKTGTTGLAGGDHLHFSVLVHHTFVNPIEWWDPHWVRNNITSKIEAIR
jgi:murein DD-endopeptidase MepM/ murein hydrolase activator NlpD